MVDEQIEEFVGELDGVKSVETEMVFTPAWSPERMSEDAKFALGF
jgi:metal-sulfur cluster biosynthetic enzyme